MQNFNKKPAMPKMHIPKTPQNLFIKKGDEVKQEVKQPIRIVAHIDELYSKAFLNDYFHS
jgi:hypothetical protein